MDPVEYIAFTKRMLTNLDTWLGIATENATTRGFDPNVLATARLAPDMFTLAGQVQAACDTAKYAPAYCAGKTAPIHADTETTITELRQRIATCKGYLDTFTPTDFAAASTQKASPKWMRGKWMPALQFVNDFSLPNFLFHVTTAYAIMRHNGVPLGKYNFLGGMELQG